MVGSWVQTPKSQLTAGSVMLPLIDAAGHVGTQSIKDCMHAACRQGNHHLIQWKNFQVQ